jgi:hypothetical protein
MRIDEIARAIEAHLVIPGGSENRVVMSVYGGATMSDLIANAGPGTLLVTSLNNSQLMRVADLMDVPGICLVDGCVPAGELLSHAEQSGTALLVSPVGINETCVRVSGCLRSAS